MARRMRFRDHSIVTSGYGALFIKDVNPAAALRPGNSVAQSRPGLRGFDAFRLAIARMQQSRSES
ncbi:hypothetical protein [Pseudoponticoccus marisrubri]|uniref:hypothetical protein n=1 Tax=Pseudoponticoccus marisrubri TaxID=1685382 RepID=UPI0012FDA6E4|nr:hypothetical protein [Pseudoponticoccus marisrubri]